MDKPNIANLSPEAQVTGTVTIGISGMTCDQCVKRVERALKALPGIKQVNVSRTEATATVTFDDSLINVTAMRDALSKSGYQPVAEPSP